jgi:hypothetical protein
MKPPLKGYVWFVAGMAFGEFVLRWVIHAGYLTVIAALAIAFLGR